MANITSLRVEIRTDASAGSSTDDRVFFDIGTRQWQLDNPGRNDFVAGRTDTFDLVLDPPLDTADIRRIRLVKSGTNGWRPGRIRVFVDGSVRYSGRVGVFLDQGSGAEQRSGVVWEAGDFPPRVADRSVIVNDIVVEVTTRNRVDASTDNRVFFTVGTREWQLNDPNRNDFERGNVDRFTISGIEGLRMDLVREIGLRKNGRDGWLPDRIRVWFNDPSAAGAPDYDGAIGIWLDGGSGAQLKHGLKWVAPDYPQPVPISTDPTGPVDQLRVEVETSSRRYSQTDDEVYLDVGTREWLLDNLARNDFESGRTDTFILEAHDGMQRSDIRRLSLRKTGTNGWRPRRVRLFVNDDVEPIFSGNADLFLDGGADAPNKYGLQWTARRFNLEVPVACWLVVGATDDTIRPARTTTASAALFDNFNTAGYRTGAGSANAIWTQGRVSFRVVSFGQVTVPDASAQMMPDATQADRNAMRDIAAANNADDVVNAYFVRSTSTGSNWFLGGAAPAVWVQDTRGGATVNTNLNFSRVAVSLAHELGHFMGLPHMCDDANNDPCTAAEQANLMMGDGTNETSIQLSAAEIATAYASATALAE